MKSNDGRKLIAAVFAIIVVLAGFSTVFYLEYKKDKTEPEEEESKPREPGFGYIEEEFTFSEPVFEEHRGQGIVAR